MSKPQTTEQTEPQTFTAPATPEVFGVEDNAELEKLANESASCYGRKDARAKELRLFDDVERKTTGGQLTGIVTIFAKLKKQEPFSPKEQQLVNLHIAVVKAKQAIGKIHSYQ